MTANITYAAQQIHQIALAQPVETLSFLVGITAMLVIAGYIIHKLAEWGWLD